MSVSMVARGRARRLRRRPSALQAVMERATKSMSLGDVPVWGMDMLSRNSLPCSVA